MFPTTLSCNIPQRQSVPKKTWCKQLQDLDSLELAIQKRKELNLTTSTNLGHVEPARSNVESDYLQDQSDAGLSDAIEHVLEFRAPGDEYGFSSNVSNQSPQANHNSLSNRGFSDEYPY